jgi:BMFP domain-containing protein YqiC
MSETGGGGKKRGGLFDDLAGVAGGAFSALAGLRAEVEAMARSQVESLVQRMELVRREELDAALEVARRAREQAEALEARVAALEARPGPGAASQEGATEATAPLEAFEPPASSGVSGEERTEATPGGI